MEVFFGDGDSGADLLEVHQHDSGVLDGVLDSSQEGDSLATIDQAVVVGESNVHHRADDNLQKSRSENKNKYQYPRRNCSLPGHS